MFIILNPKEQVVHLFLQILSNLQPENIQDFFEMLK